MKRAVLNHVKAGKTIVTRSDEVAADRSYGPDVEAALRAIGEKIDSIGSHLDRSAAVLGRLEAKLGEAL